MNTAETTAPDWIPRDTFKGKFIRTFSADPDAYCEAWTAKELAEYAPTGVVWERFTEYGGPVFWRSRYVADPDGRIHTYQDDGSKKCTHPPERTLHIAVRRAAPKEA